MMPLQGIYSAITPGWFATPVYGNDHYLWPSAYFWFCIIITVVLALLPRFLAKAYQQAFNPTDLDKMRYLHKYEPDHDFSNDGPLYPRNAKTQPSLKRKPTNASRRPYSNSFAAGSRTDMATGLQAPHRGFDFATEENGGVALQRIQTNLSEQQGKHRMSFRRPKRVGSLLPSFSLPRSLRRKKPPPSRLRTQVDSPESSYSRS